MRARMAILSAQITVDLREILLRDKPAQMLSASPKGTVPVLELGGGNVIDESLDVMRWALGQNDPGGWLAGDNEGGRRLIAQNDGPFKHHLDRYKYAARYDGADASEHRAAGADILAELNGRLDGQPFLMGARETLPDIALFPFVRQFANADRDWFDAQPMGHLQRWLSAFLGDPRFAAIMTKLPLWQPGDAPLHFPPQA